MESRQRNLETRMENFRNVYAVEEELEAKFCCTMVRFVLSWSLFFKFVVPCFILKGK